MKRFVISALVVGGALGLCAQTPTRPPGDGPEFDGPPPFRPFVDGPGGPGRPGGPMRQELKLVEQFDRNGDKRLNAAERKAAREFVQKERTEGRGRRGPRGPRGDEDSGPPQPGPKVSPTEVKSYPDAPLFDPLTVRTVFLEFESADWEKELADFNNTDVEVPATLTVDGPVYRDVGVHFRGASSFMTVGEGRKRSLNLSLDFVHDDQRVYGHRTLNLLNSHEDPSFLRTVLYSHIARDYIPAPRANFARVVINGESWGVYVVTEQFNKDFVNDRFGTTKGARWKVPGRPNGDAELTYLGDDVLEYRKRYEIKSKDEPRSWARLIELCRVLSQTPANQLEAALAPLLDIEGALKFLAIENALINNDGYWVRASDYSLYLDEQGRFHLIPHDTNETFSRPGGPGFGGGPGGRRFRPNPGPGSPPEFEPNRPGDRPTGSASASGPGDRQGPRVNGVELDPLVAAKDANKPLLSKLLAVPTLRTRYLGYVRNIAAKWLDWAKLGPLAQRYHTLIAADVKADTRKLESYEAFANGLAAPTPAAPTSGVGRPGGPKMSLKSFADQRRAYLLNHPGVKAAASQATR